MKSSIILVGMPGAGKTTVGQLLAEQLDAPFIDVDAEIEYRQGRPISEIFANDGEDGFRRIEAEVTLSLIADRVEAAVISLGGGAVLTKTIRDALAGLAVVWLDVSVVHATRRVGMNRLRPLLLGDVRARLEKLLAERRQIYEDVATLRVETDSLTVAEVTATIMAYLNMQGTAPEGNLSNPVTDLETEDYPAVLFKTANPYQVVFGSRTVSKLANLANEVSRAAIVFDRELPEIAEQVAAQLHPVGLTMIPIPSGEAAKTVEVLADAWSKLANGRITRSDLIIGVGGGATTDLAGFLAATWMRGVRLANVPTTVLAMADASIGGKTGINIPEGKNLVGAFHEPSLVICDTDFLANLPQPEIVSGMGEIVKCGFIRDAEILRLIQDSPGESLDRSSLRFRELIRRAAQVKADVVSADLYESTSHDTNVGREMLNYGHTLAHAIEAQDHFGWRHGEADAVGMTFAAELASRLGLISAEVVALHRNIFASIGLPTSYQGSWKPLRDRMGIDKKTRGDRLRFVLLDGGPGQVRIVENPDEDLLSDAFESLGR